MGIRNPNKQKTEEHRRRLIDLSGVPGEWFLLNLIITELSASNYRIYEDEIAITGYGVAPLRELYQRLCQTELAEKDWFRKYFVASEGLLHISKSILAAKDKVVDMDIPEDFHIILEKIFENCSLIKEIDETESNILRYGVMDSEQYIVNCILAEYLPLISDYVPALGAREEDSPYYLRIPEGGVILQDGYGMVAFYLLAFISKYWKSASTVYGNQKVVAESSSSIVRPFTDSLFNWSNYYSRGLEVYYRRTERHFVSYDNSVDDDIKIELEKLLQRSCFDSFAYHDAREKYKSCEFGSLMNPDNVYEYLYSIEDRDKLYRLLSAVVNEIHFLRRNKNFFISNFADADFVDCLGGEIVSAVYYWQKFATHATQQANEDNTIGGAPYDKGLENFMRIIDLGLEYLYPLEGINIRKVFENYRFDADMMKSMVESALCDDISLKEMISEALDDLDIVNMRNPGRENMNALNGNTYVETVGGDD